ncbi:anthranilate phosphoribosyltransferase [Pendulispora brunnea]|uniref:Anthranilate phosphoribosyltransferase n=1 Tax=Pendulispora brunnea TaxID=2905690 RepID=A0ABZ2JYU4_9BACT
MSDSPSLIRFADVLPKLAARDIDSRLVRAAFDAILQGAWTPTQVGAFAVALRLAGETSEMIVAATEALRATMTAVDVADDEPVVDTCGTGGDGAQTLNLSTAAAIVAAAAGLRVAKHGNRSVSSRCGSADVLEALGVPTDVPPELQVEVLREVGIAFLFAPAHHPALKHAAQARRELGVRTIFNVIGPLANPARATHQLVGVYDDALRPIMARALSRIGLRAAWVVRSEDGLDEISPSASTYVTELSPDGTITERIVVPEDFGFERQKPEAFAGSTAEENARAISTILRGEPHPATDAVILNAAAALMVAETATDPREAAERAREAIASGKTVSLLAAWQRATTRRRRSE